MYEKSVKWVPLYIKWL